MAQQKAKGSIIYELLIVILIAGLIGSIIYPKSVWEEEETKAKLCRDRMMHIMYAEALYKTFTNTYTDSLPELVDFILSDTTVEKLHQFIRIDSTLQGKIIDFISEKGDQEDIVAALDSMVAKLENDTVTVPYLAIERLNQRIPGIPMETLLGDWKVLGDSTLLVDTLVIDIPLKHVLAKGPDYVSNDDIVRTLWFAAIEIEEAEFPEDWVMNVLTQSPVLAFKADSMAEATIQTFSLCPTVGDSLIVTVVDTSALKHLKIACPIDSRGYGLLPGMGVAVINVTCSKPNACNKPRT